MSWKIYFPFQLMDRHTIKALPADGSIGGYQATLRINQPYYVLELSRIRSIEDANRVFKQLLNAFYWMTTDIGLMGKFGEDLQQVYYPPDPLQAAKNLTEVTGLKHVRIDGVMDGGRPAILEEGPTVSVMTGQLVDFEHGHSPITLLAALDTGFQLSDGTRPLPEKIKSALAAYKLAHFFAEGSARFMILWSVVEALAPRSQRLPLIEDHVNALIAATEAKIPISDSDEKKDALRRLISQIGNLKRQSHTERIRNYVASILQRNSIEDYSQIAEVTIELYRRRGSFTHGDSTEIGDGLSQLDAIVRQVLKAAIKSA